jgi:hypothetical protein
MCACDNNQYNKPKSERVGLEHPYAPARDEPDHLVLCESLPREGGNMGADVLLRFWYARRVGLGCVDAPATEGDFGAATEVL